MQRMDYSSALLAGVAALALMAVFAVQSAAAQNVLLPQGPSASSTATPAPKSSLPDLQNSPGSPNGTKSTYSLNDALQRPAVVNTIYATVAQQNQLADMERRNLLILQNALNEMQSSQDMLQQTPEGQKYLPTFEKNGGPLMDELKTRIATSQKRLAALQAGPMKIVDLNNLYQR